MSLIWLLLLGLTVPGIRGQINALASVLEFADSEEGRSSSHVLERPTESKLDGNRIDVIYLCMIRIL